MVNTQYTISIMNIVVGILLSITAVGIIVSYILLPLQISNALQLPFTTTLMMILVILAATYSFLLEVCKMIYITFKVACEQPWN